MLYETLASVKYSQLDGNVVLAHELVLCETEVIAFYTLSKYCKGEELDKLLLPF